MALCHSQVTLIYIPASFNMYLVINKWVIAVKVSNFSGYYLRNRSTLDIGVLGYIGIVWPKEHSPEVWHISPGTPCIIYFTSFFCYNSYAVCLCGGSIYSPHVDATFNLARYVKYWDSNDYNMRTCIKHVWNMLIVNCITDSCVWNTGVTWQVIDYKLPEDDTIVSKHVAVW